MSQLNSRSSFVSPSGTGCGPDRAASPATGLDRQGGPQPPDEGAVAVIIAICLLLLFGAGAIAIDLGSGWETKRDLLVDTDAAAFAAAQVAVEKGCDTGEARAAAEEFLSSNLGSTVTLSVPDQFDCSGGKVKITFTDAAQQTLSGALGVEELNVLSSSTVEFRDAFGPLRPIGICNDLAPIKAALASPPGEDGVPLVVSMEKSWHSPGGCGGEGGYWGWLCFAGNCGDSEVRPWMRDGYTGSVDLGSDEVGKRNWDDAGRDEDCDPPAGQDTCTTSQGNVPNLNSQMGADLKSLVGEQFSILVTDKIYPASACATHPCVHPWGFAYVRLDALCRVGANVNNTTLVGASDAMPNEASCKAQGGSNGDIVFAFQLFGVSQDGEPSDFSPLPALFEQCGIDHDDGDVGSGDRCDGVFHAG